MRSSVAHTHQFYIVWSACATARPYTSNLRRIREFTNVHTSIRRNSPRSTTRLLPVVPVAVPNYSIPDIGPIIHHRIRHLRPRTQSRTLFVSSAGPCGLAHGGTIACERTDRATSAHGGGAVLDDRSGGLVCARAVVLSTERDADAAARLVARPGILTARQSGLELVGGPRGPEAGDRVPVLVS